MKQSLAIFRHRRRELMVVLAAFPILVRAASSRSRKRLAVLSPTDEETTKEVLAEVLAALAKLGYPEGERLEVLVRFDLTTISASEAMVREALAWRPDVILTQGTAMTHRVREATRTIPIVTSTMDPVASGFAQSLARPGGNVTGLSQGAAEVAVKMVDVMRLMVPRLALVAILHEDLPGPAEYAAHYERAARAAGLDPLMVKNPNREELLGAIEKAAARKVQAIYIAAVQSREAREAVRLRLPLFTNIGPGEVGDGALAMLDSEAPAMGPITARYVERIFEGASPASLPITFPDRFRLVVSRRTARAIGLKLTPEILLRADEVID